MARKAPSPIPNWRQVLPPDAVERAEHIAVARHIEVDRMFNGASEQEVIRARWDLIHWLHMKGLSYPAIGRMLGIHYSTAINAVSKFATQPDKSHHVVGVPVHRGIGREFDRYRAAAGGPELV